MIDDEKRYYWIWLFVNLVIMIDAWHYDHSLMPIWHSKLNFMIKCFRIVCTQGYIFHVFLLFLFILLNIMFIIWHFTNKWDLLWYQLVLGAICIVFMIIEIYNPLVIALLGIVGIPCVHELASWLDKFNV